MSDAQIKKLINIYKWALILLAGGIGFALATIPSYHAFIVQPEKAWFPLNLLTPYVALVAEAIAAPGMIILYLKSRRLLALSGEERLSAFNLIRNTQSILGGMVMVGAAIITPLSLVFLIWAIASPVGLVFTYLLYSGAGIHMKIKSLNKEIDFPETIKKDVDTNEANIEPEPAETPASKPTRERGSGAFGLAMTSLAITALMTLPVYIGFFTGHKVGNSDLGTTFALSIAELFVAPTAVIAALYSLVKKQQLAWRTSLFAAIALILAIFPWGFRLGG